ncbi:MAG: hypothetical protein Q4P72_00555 [Eubacteriales bacterium]|nr:hypothetical protein [Eubacteriales bacterium]
MSKQRADAKLRVRQRRYRNLFRLLIAMFILLVLLIIARFWQLKQQRQAHLASLQGEPTQGLFSEPSTDARVELSASRAAETTQDSDPGESSSETDSPASDVDESEEESGESSTGLEIKIDEDEAVEDWPAELAVRGDYLRTNINYNLRSQATTESTLVASLPANSVLRVQGIASNSEGEAWYRIYAYNQWLYLFADPNFERLEADPFAKSTGDVQISDDLLFENDLLAFPESYKPYLRALHRDHPKWKFEAVELAADFEASVESECSIDGRNLIVPSAHTPGSQAMAKNQKVYDGGGYVSINREATAYFLDPRNFLHEEEIFQFESMAAGEGQTEEGVRLLFEDNEDLRDLSSILFETCKTLDFNAYTFATRIKNEVGIGSRITNAAQGLIDPYCLPIHVGEASITLMSPEEQRQALQRYEAQLKSRGADLPAKYKQFKRELSANPEASLAPPVERYYNFANIGAYPNVSRPDGAAINAIYYAMGYNTGLSEDEKLAYELPWNSREKALRGALKWIKSQYVDEGQDTIYFQKWDVKGDFPGYWHQYMGSVLAPEVEGYHQYKTYQQAGMLDEAIRFLIPVYTNMPDELAPHPATILHDREVN